MSRRARTLAVAFALAGLAAAGWLGADSARTWAIPVLSSARYPLGCGLFFLLWLAVDRGPPRWRPWLLVGACTVQGLYFDPIVFAALAAWVLAFRRVLVSRVPGAVKVGFYLASLGALALACDAHDFPRLAARHPELSLLGKVYAMALLLQSLRVLVDAHAAGWPHITRRHLFVQLLLAPYWIQLPYMLCIPRLGEVGAAIHRRDERVVADGVRTLAISIPTLVVLQACQRHGLDPRSIYIALLRGGHVAAAVPVGLLYYPAQCVLGALAEAGVIAGLVRLLGIPVPRFADAPMLAEDLADWWRRWNIAFRELIVDVCWYPVVLRLRRRPRLAIFAGCAAVFLAGSPLLHWPKVYFLHGVPSRLPIGAIVEGALMFFAIAVLLLLERRRAARGSPPQRGRGRWARRAVTWVELYLIVSVAGYGAEYWLYVRTSP